MRWNLQDGEQEEEAAAHPADDPVGQAPVMLQHMKEISATLEPQFCNHTATTAYIQPADDCAAGDRKNVSNCKVVLLQLWGSMP